MDTTKFVTHILLVLVVFYMGYPNLSQPEETPILGVVRILPILILILTVIQTPEVDHTHAQQLKYFKYGLIFSLIGDPFMNWKSAYFHLGM